MYTTEFRYIPSSQNSQIFLAHYSPGQQIASAGVDRAVILVPPFAEEMNRSKRMYVLCARRLAGAGIHVFCFDFAGNGDSYGDWGEYGYADWKTNLLDIYRYVLQAGISDINLITLRFGALLSADTIVANQLQINKCIFWDPVENGENYMRQLIRVKIAAAMAEESKKISTKEILAEVEQQGFTEIGGYQVSASVIDSVNQLKMSKYIESMVMSTDLYWITTGKTNKKNASPLQPTSIPENLIEKLSIQAVSDTRFWMQQEVTIAPVLLEHTYNLFSDDR